MPNKIKNLPYQTYIRALSDVRNIGLIVFAVIALLVTWSGIKVVQTNYDLQKQISTMQQQNAVRKLENSNLELRNQYYNTDQYLELVARRQYNKALPGEKLLIVPETVALSHTVDVAGATTEQDKATIQDEGPWYERNFNAWLDFLFRQ
jgi:cell division protein FtsB